MAETRKLIEREVEKSVRVERLNQELPGCVRAEVARAQALAAARVEGFEGSGRLAIYLNSFNRLRPPTKPR